MHNNNREKTTSPRRSILTMLLGGVFLFFAIYYVVLRDLNAQSRKEVVSRMRNVSSCLDALREKSAETAWWVASRPDVIAAVEKHDSSALREICGEIASKVRISVIAVTDASGKVIASRASSEAAENMAELLVTKQALAGNPAAGIEEDRILEMKMRAACPVLSRDNRVIGAVVAGMNLFSDHTFVDGIIKNFGLVCSVFHNDVRVSTTIYQEGKRATGTKLNNQEIQREVLEKGGTYQGRNKAVNKEYDTAYWPLKNIEGRIIGVLGIGKDRETITRIFTITAIVVLLVTGFIGIVVTRQSFRLQSLILLIIVPAMILSTAAAGWLLYRNLHAIILDGFNRKLSALSTTTASCLDGDKLRGFLDKRDSQSPGFQEYMDRLRKIQKQKDVTYLYTFIMGGKKDIIYIIDASEGEDFCPLGYEENLPMQNIDGLRRVFSDGTPYISEIQEYERYGLLKVGAAPIYGGSTNVQALAGVDINISIIRNKLRVAISHVLAVGAIALILAGLVSFWFSRKLTVPLTRLKSGALLLAAGQYDHRIEITEPLELQTLASAFNRVGNTIGGILRKAAENNEKTEAERRRAELAKDFSDIANGNEPGEQTALLLHWLGGCQDYGELSGAVANKNLVITWLAGVGTDKLASAKTRRDIADICQRLLARRGSDRKHVTDTLRLMLNDSVPAFILFDTETGIITPVSRDSVTAVLMESSGSLKKLSIAAGREITVQPGSTIILPSQLTVEILSGIREQKLEPGSAENPASAAAALESLLCSAVADTGALSKGLFIVLKRRNPT